MAAPKRLLPAAAVVAAITALSGCSIDTVIWGPEGAHVIDTTERLIDAGAAGDAAAFACADSVADFGDPSDWEGLSAGEPERFTGNFWEDQVPREPTWSINLELGRASPEAGLVFPGDVFYKDGDDGLCVVDIVWSTIAS